MYIYDWCIYAHVTHGDGNVRNSVATTPNKKSPSNTWFDDPHGQTGQRRAAKRLCPERPTKSEISRRGPTRNWSLDDGPRDRSETHKHHRGDDTQKKKERTDGVKGTPYTLRSIAWKEQPRRSAPSTTRRCRDSPRRQWGRRLRKVCTRANRYDWREVAVVLTQIGNNKISRWTYQKCIQLTR